MSVAKLDSHGSDLFGVLVPVPESDFSYRSPLFGAELTLKKTPDSTPAGEPVVAIANRPERGSMRGIRDRALCPPLTCQNHR